MSNDENARKGGKGGGGRRKLPVKETREILSPLSVSLSHLLFKENGQRWRQMAVFSDFSSPPGS